MPDTVPGSGGQDEKEERCGNFNRKRQEVKVCDIINGIPKVKRVEKGEYMEFRLRYSLFHREIKRYDKETFEEIKRR